VRRPGLFVVLARAGRPLLAQGAEALQQAPLQAPLPGEGDDERRHLLEAALHLDGPLWMAALSADAEFAEVSDAAARRASDALMR
jgi:hypothetical protein